VTYLAIYVLGDSRDLSKRLGFMGYRKQGLLEHNGFNRHFL